MNNLPKHNNFENNFVLSLEDNAIDSLIHAVEHFLDEDEDRPTNVKYAILHVFHAVELFLKAKLASINPDLIFDKPKKDGTQYTIGLDKAIKCIEEQGVVLSELDKENLDILRKVRNEIEHYKFLGNRKQVKEYVGRAMYFLESFLQQELGIILKKELDECDLGIYETLSKAQLFYIRRMLEAGIELHPKYKGLDGYDFVTCQECEEDEVVVIPDPTTPDDSVHCFLCHARYSFSVNYCLRCESKNYSLHLLETDKGLFTFDKSDDESCYYLCDRCQEDIEDE